MGTKHNSYTFFKEGIYMCGIIGYVGKKEKTLSVLMDGLTNLEYRGYDSAGIAYFGLENIEVFKQTGKVHTLEKEIKKQIHTCCGIGHTRWATHGKPTVLNAHPHRHGKFTLVHNGIIENADELKVRLLEEGYEFYSDTDTEVAVALLDFIYRRRRDVLTSIHELMGLLEGSYAFAILCEDHPDNIYIAKNASPLIVGVGIQEMYVASDVPAILQETSKYIILEDMEYGKVEKNGVHIYNMKQEEIPKAILEFEGSMDSAKKNGYAHFMLKEMMEEPEILKNLFHSYWKDPETWKNNLPDFEKYREIDIVACGSAYHAGMIGKYYLENYLGIPVTVSLASEYRYQTLFSRRDKLVIFVSQSGETADTLACLKLVKGHGMDTFAIVNVVGSSIARIADYVLYTKAGYELAVATTKAYIAQVAAFLFVVLSYGKVKIERFDIETLYDIQKKLLDIHHSKIVKYLSNASRIFFIGRQVDYALAMEASLKLKEISYLMSDAYAAGELKHGTISLIEEGTPVVAIVTDPKVAEKTISNIKEVKARGAYVVLVISSDLDDSFDWCDQKIVIPEVSSILMPLVTILPLQMLAYDIALNKGCDIDQPRNLAKSVTVE